jgi:hypothetical protein
MSIWERGRFCGLMDEQEQHRTFFFKTIVAWELSHTTYASDPATVDFFLLLKWETTFKGRLQDS